MPNTISLVLPVAKEYQITQLFGENPEFYQKHPEWKTKSHNGIDFGTPMRTTTWATAKGDIYKVGFEVGGFGNYVYILHDFGITVHAHLDEYFVKKGDVVEQGDAIGYTGNTGASSGAHLHFGLKTMTNDNGWNGYIDPMPYFYEKKDEIIVDAIDNHEVGTVVKIISDVGANIRDENFNKIGYAKADTKFEIVGKPIEINGLIFYPVKYGYIAKKDGYGDVIFE